MTWLCLVMTASGAEVLELTLDEAIDRLYAEGPDIARSEARAEQARALATQTRAGFLPNVSVGGQYVHNDAGVVLGFGDILRSIIPEGQPIPPGVPEAVVIQPDQAWTASGAVRIPLFAPAAWADSTGASRGARSADALADAVALDLESTLVRLAAGAEAADGVALAAERGVATAGAHLSSTRVAIAAGTATSIDELSARALEAQRRSELALASNERDRLREELGGLLGLDGPVRIVLPEEPAEGAATVPPELVAARERYDASRAKTAAGGWRYAPVISAFGTAQASTVEFATGRDTRWTVGLDATLPLFDGGLREGRLDQARAERDEAEAALRSQEDAVERALRNAERELQTAHERLVLASEQAALAVEASEVAARGLAAGATSPLQARDAETDAFAAQVSVAGARARLLVAVAALRRAKGQDQRW